ISLPPPAIALANLLRISFRPPSTLLANLVSISPLPPAMLLTILRAHAGLAIVRQTVGSGATAVPLRRRPSDPALGTPLLRRDCDLVRVPGCALPPVLAQVRPIALPAVELQPVLHTPVFAELAHRLLLLAARAELRRHRLHGSHISVGVASSFFVPGTKTFPMTRTAGGLVRYSNALSKNLISSLLWPTTSRLHGLQSKPLTIPD